MIYIYRYHTFIRRLVFLSWSEVEYIVFLSLPLTLPNSTQGKKAPERKYFTLGKFRRHYPLPLSQVYWPPKKYQDKNKKTQKVWNFIFVGLANKQCAIVLRFSPKWEQVVWTNYDPWNVGINPYRAFAHDVTAAILVSQNNETAAMLVSQTNPPPVGVVLFSYANDFFCSNKFA